LHIYLLTKKGNSLPEHSQGGYCLLLYCIVRYYLDLQISVNVFPPVSSL
jgi:hypothetical protein